MNVQANDVRSLSVSDLERLLVIEQAAQQTPWSEDTFRQCFLSDSRKGWGILYGQVLVGFIWVSMVPPEAEILNIAIEPSFQGKGLGKQLIRNTLLEMNHLGILKVFLEVRETNVTALELYRSLGFKKTGVRKHYYLDLKTKKQEDAVLMVMKLENTNRL